MQYDNAGNIIENIDNFKTDPVTKNLTKKLVGVKDEKTTNDTLIKRENNYVEPELKKQLKYPLADSGNHYVRFWINLDEESKLIKEKKVVTTGNVDNTDQNRRNTNSATTATATAAMTAGGAVWGASKALDTVPGFLTKLAGNATDPITGKTVSLDPFKGKGLAGNPRLAAIIAGAGAVGGGLAGAAVGLTEDFKLAKRLKRLATSISLYAPSGISSSYHLGWSQTDSMLLDIAQKSQVSAIGDMLQNRPASTSIGRIALTANSETFSNLGRTAVNSRRDMLFQSVGNRKFKFDYVFAPRSKEEAQEVADIIYAFKLFAHPELLEGYANYLYLYPAEFDIEYRMIDAYGKDIENPYINKISSCVLESIDVVYANRGSYQSLANGEPVMTSLSLTFMEIETLHQDRIKKGF